MLIVLVLLAVAVVALAAVCAVAWSRVRGARRRLAALVARLDEIDLATVETAANLESSVSQMQRAVEARMRAEDAHAADRRRLFEALHALDEGVVIADEAGQLVFANPSARRFLGGRRVDAVVDNRIRELLDGAVADQRGATDELELLGPPRRTLEFDVHHVDDGRRSIGAVLFVRDRTHTRQVDALRRDFVDNISHELKTPVGALGVLAETLAETLDEPEIAARLAGRLIDESTRLMRIIDDLLALARLEAEDSASREALVVQFLVADAIERVRSGLVESDRTFEIDIAHDIEVVGDRRQLTSALYNLVENAVKYSDPHRPVRVVADNVGTDRVRISVVDQGSGIPVAERERIFERFYRLDRARSRASGGTGLGLAIVRHVVSNHGGEIDVASEEGLGSVFSILLRAPARADAGADTAAPGYDVDLSDVRVEEGRWS
ncbi:MAG: PAS domain-containing protein [Acidimicrobiia bacterium]|nr:PAS domain-containing protein [Acidimicrobiia bacterium]